MIIRFVLCLLVSVLATPNVSAAVRVQLAHLAPLSANVDLMVLDVRVNGAEVAADLRYGEVRSIELGGTGTYTFDIRLANSGTTLVSASGSAVDGEQFTVAIVGNNDEKPLSIYILADTTVTPPAGSALVRFLNVAPSAGDMFIRNGPFTVEGLGGLSYAGPTPYVTFAAGTYDFRVTPVFPNLTIVDPPPITIAAGTIRQYAIAGDGERQPIQLIPLIAREGPIVVDYSAQGAWTTGNAQGQGMTLYAIPSERRLTGAWYTFTPQGQQQWFTLDTCRTPVGSTGCTNAGAFNNRTAVMTVYRTTGGGFLSVAQPTITVAGTLTIIFESCTEATATYNVDAFFGSFRMTNLLPAPNCTIVP